MKPFLFLPFLLLATPLPAEEKKEIPLAAQENILQVLETLQGQISSPDFTQENASAYLTNALSTTKALVESSRQAETQKTEALFAKIEATCLSAEKASDLDALFATVTKESLATKQGYGRGHSAQQNLRAASTIIGCWQDHLIAKESGGAKASLRALDQVIQSLQQSPCIARSKVLALKKGIEKNAAKQQQEEALAKKEAKAQANSRNFLNRALEDQEQRRNQHPMLPDPEWPTALASIDDITPLLERLRRFQLDFKKEHPGHYSQGNTYGDLESRLTSVQLAAAAGDSFRSADVITQLGSRNRYPKSQLTSVGSGTNYPPPASLVANIKDIEATLVLTAFQSLFGTSVGIEPEGNESPRSYVTRLSEAFSAQEKYDQLTELLSLIQTAGIFASGTEGAWISADIKGISAYQKATAFLQAEDLRNAVPALREVIESAGRTAPATKAAKILADLKTSHPDEMKRIR